MSDKHVMIGALAVVAVVFTFVCVAMLGSLDPANLSKPAATTAQAPPAIRPELPTEPVTPIPNKRRGSPFEHKILSEEWYNTLGRKGVTIKLQVADDVAPTVTEDDLELLAAEFMKKYEGAEFGAYFYTVTPLTGPWARISYLPLADEKLEWQIIESALEMGPWYFPDRIDPNVEWHKLVWLTLPMANKIVNGATQFNWKLEQREPNSIYLDSKSEPLGSMSDRMYLSPQALDIDTYDEDVSRFVRLVESSLNHLDYEFSQKIVTKLNSVIGSSEYLSREKEWWEWQVDGLEVNYSHLGRNNKLSIFKTK